MLCTRAHSFNVMKCYWCCWLSRDHIDALCFDLPFSQRVFVSLRQPCITRTPRSIQTTFTKGQTESSQLHRASSCYQALSRIDQRADGHATPVLSELLPDCLTISMSGSPALSTYAKELVLGDLPAKAHRPPKAVPVDTVFKSNSLACSVLHIISRP
jgi:hypothetical protein